MDHDASYAPQSPDLSSFFSAPAKSQQPYHPQAQHQQPHPQSQQLQHQHALTDTTDYAPRSPTIPSFNHHNHHPAAQPPTSTYNHNAPTVNQESSYAQSYPSFTGYPHQGQGSGIGGGGKVINSNFDSFEAADTQYQIPDLPPQHTFNNYTNPPSQPPFYAPNAYADSPQSYADPNQPPQFKSEDASYASHSDPYSSSPLATTKAYNQPPLQPTPNMSRRIGSRPSVSDPSAFSHEPPPPLLRDPNPTNIQISTKFPTARIKRIMQADEEVGKVAQVTPPAVNKALELFMIALVSGAADKAREKGGKRVTAAHLKQVVLGDEQFDFLAEIVGRVEEGKEEGGAGSRKRKGKTEGGVKEEKGSDSSEEAAEGKKKKGKGGRRKKVPDE